MKIETLKGVTLETLEEVYRMTSEDVARTRLRCHIFSESTHMGTLDEFKKTVGKRSKRRR